jgi:hypothetical protein
MGPGNIGGIRLSNFWEGKDPCWVVLNCSKYVRVKCPAYLNKETPCWEIAYTQCEILLGIKRDCKNCRVYKLYHVSKTGHQSATPLKKDAQ